MTFDLHYKSMNIVHNHCTSLYFAYRLRVAKSSFWWYRTFWWYDIGWPTFKQINHTFGNVTNAHVQNTCIRPSCHWILFDFLYSLLAADNDAFYCCVNLTFCFVVKNSFGNLENNYRKMFFCQCSLCFSFFFQRLLLYNKEPLWSLTLVYFSRSIHKLLIVTLTF